MNPEWLRKYQPMSTALMEYGWFLPTYLIGSDFEKIEKLCAKIEANPPSNQAERQSVEDHIYYVMIDIAFHANWRTRAVSYGMRLPHFREFSHIYESGIFSYYKREYPACILLLLCALEGILRSFSGLEHPTFRQLTDAVRNAAPQQLPEAHKMYSAILAEFLERWIYKRTTSADADFSLSVLNRHYVMHGLSPGEFYRPQDVHRLVLAFDLLIDFLGVHTGIHDSVFLPDPGTDAAFDKRRDYYFSLSEGDYTIKQTWKMERSLLKEHSRYVEPRLPEPDAVEAQVRSTLDLLSTMSKARAMRPQPDGAAPTAPPTPPRSA